VPFPNEMFFDNELELEIKLDGESLGRTPISSVPYSHTSASVSAGGVKLTDLSQADVAAGPPGILNGMIKYEEDDGFFGYHDGAWQALLGGDTTDGGGSALDSFFSIGTDLLTLNSPLKIVGDLTVTNLLKTRELQFDNGVSMTDNVRGDLLIESPGFVSIQYDAADNTRGEFQIADKDGTVAFRVKKNGRVSGVLDDLEFDHAYLGSTDDRNCHDKCEAKGTGWKCIWASGRDSQRGTCGSSSGALHCLCVREKP
jgi:hypothetical protein